MPFLLPGWIRTCWFPDEMKTFMKTTKSLFGILTITAALAVQVQAQSYLTNGQAKADSQSIRSPSSSPLPAPAGFGKQGERWTNSLGMVFTPVPGTKVWFSIWTTRQVDYAAFPENGRESWPADGTIFPVANVSWFQAMEFCNWLTKKERSQGWLNDNQSYRLPSDLEWSAAVGLEPEGGGTRDARWQNALNHIQKCVPRNTPKDTVATASEAIYPWGKVYPPPDGVGNYRKQVDGIWKPSGGPVAVGGYPTPSGNAHGTF